jgi:hypothetical protein
MKLVARWAQSSLETKKPALRLEERAGSPEQGGLADYRLVAIAVPTES